MVSKYDYFSDTLTKLQRQKRYRQLEPMVPINAAYLLYQSVKMLSFCSHDYLGLADNPDSKKNAIKFLLQHGITASSECKDLYLSCQQQLEEKFGALLQRESALFFPSRFEANVTSLATLARPGAIIFMDEASHPSLVQGATSSPARLQLYPHLRLDRLEHLLDDAGNVPKIIASESIFSSSGDVANLPTLIELADHFDALLYVDDSHGFGVTGVDGMGLCGGLGEIDVVAGSLSKACGAYGGYVACSHLIRDFLVNCTPIKTSYLFPPSIIGAIDAALEMIPQMEGERKQLQQRSHWLRAQLREMGFELPKATTPLLSISFPDEEESIAFRDALKQEQIFIGPVRKAPEQGCSINLALNICHMPDHLSQLVNAIKGWRQVAAVS
ncbi:MAG: 8-amino-7-oxononanoate synthase [Chlamydiae bacterium]|nr:8-amino-7-oxononanoate synthase [Chlamydiota bacterium]